MMVSKKNKLFPNRDAVKQFLFYKTDPELEKDREKETNPRLDPEDMVKRFPNILSGENFVDDALKRLEDSSEFGSMVIRIEHPDNKNNIQNTGKMTKVWVKAAQVVHAVCESDNGIWGALDNNTFGCFFAEKNETSILDIAKRIQENFSKISKKTVSIGASVYPCIDFKKGQILENAFKALDHAGFFGPKSLVLFDSVSLNISGDRCYHKGDIDGAVKEFKTALFLDPLNVNVRNSLGVCYGVQGDYDKALKEFNEALGINRQEAMVLYNIGLIYMLKNSNKKALKWFIDSYDKDESVFETAFQIGKIYLEIKEPGTGKSFLEKAVMLKPESGPAFRYLGECCAALNMTKEAISAYKKAIRKNPNDAYSLSALGCLFDLQGENPEITSIFCQQSVDIEPDNGLFRYRLGSFYLKRDQLKEALKQFQKADELGHDSKDIIKKVRKLIKKDKKATG